MKIDQLAAILNLLNVPKIDPQKVRNLVSKFNIPKSIFSLTEQELCGVEGIDLKSAKSIRSFNDFDIGKKLAEKTICYILKRFFINLNLVILRSNFAGCFLTKNIRRGGRAG